MANPPRSERPSMQGYGVTDDPTGVLPWSWAEQRLLECRNFWFVTVRPDGRPHSMPVWGAWMPDRQRWGFGCASSSRKSRNLTTNPHVVVTTEDTVELVSIEGVARPIAGNDAVPLVEAWVDKYADEVGVVDEESRERARDFVRGESMFEITPQRAFGLIERPDEFASAATRWVWD
ncbi:MAG: pyridoxamine 5'-phosphate oxidase family protein [Actinomycetota bacterium]